MTQSSTNSPLQQSPYATALSDASQVLACLASLEDQVAVAAQWCLNAFSRGNKLLVCGNGGSAAEAQHLVGELVGRYKRTRAPLPAIALSADSTLLTCIGNDFDFQEIFARQVQALGHAGDLLIAFTTSGSSPNILRAIEMARSSKMQSIGFLGRDGGAALPMVDCSLTVPHHDTARIQEGHNFLMHCLMDQVEAAVQITGQATSSADHGLGKSVENE